MGGIIQVILYKGTIIGLPKYEELSRQDDLYKRNLIEITQDDTEHPAWIFTNNYIYLRNATKKEIVTQKNERVELTVESIENHFEKEDWITPINEEKEDDTNEVFRNDIYIAEIHWREDFRGLYDPRIQLIKVPYKPSFLLK